MAGDEEEERHCPVCDGVSCPAERAGVYGCSRCGTRARFDGDMLIAVDIPNYRLRLRELRMRNLELVALIEGESARGSARDMAALRSLHEERQRVLSEYSFMSYFEQFVERW